MAAVSTIIAGFIASRVVLKMAIWAFRFMLFSLFSTIIFIFTQSLLQTFLNFLDDSMYNVFALLVYLGVIQQIQVIVALMVQSAIVILFISFFKNEKI